MSWRAAKFEYFLTTAVEMSWRAAKFEYFLTTAVEKD